MFQFPTYPLITLLFHVMISRHLRLDEFPHSEICGLQTICVSPQLIAACHVLHRLLIPRHSPYALISLTFYLSILFFLDSLYSSLSIFDYPKSHLYLNYSLAQYIVLYFRYLLPLFVYLDICRYHSLYSFQCTISKS